MSIILKILLISKYIVDDRQLIFGLYFFLEKIMQVEECCSALLELILPSIDKDRSGWAIDVGVGTFCFYCEQFARLGFRTAAVEPLPVEELKNLCSKFNIRLVETCLS